MPAWHRNNENFKKPVRNASMYFFKHYDINYHFSIIGAIEN